MHGLEVRRGHVCVSLRCFQVAMAHHLLQTEDVPAPAQIPGGECVPRGCSVRPGAVKPNKRQSSFAERSTLWRSSAVSSDVANRRDSGLRLKSETRWWMRRIELRLLSIARKQTLPCFQFPALPTLPSAHKSRHCFSVLFKVPAVSSSLPSLWRTRQRRTATTSHHHPAKNPQNLADHFPHPAHNRTSQQQIRPASHRPPPVTPLLSRFWPQATENKCFSSFSFAQTAENK